jgi:ABC-2 type transport system ATP-binding protein
MPTRAPSADVPLAIDSLVVQYGDRRAVERLSLVVGPGEIYGLLGSNGAGKSSTLKSVVGLLKPADGRVAIFGIDPQVDGVLAKQRVGYVSESPLLYDALTPREFLEFVASVRRLPASEATARAGTFAAALQVEAEFDRPLGTLSNGTRQKILLIAAFLHSPGLLVLDEPLSNLDPRSVRIINDLLHAYVADGLRGVLVSTHAMEVAERLCTRVGILDGGVLRGEGTLSELRSVVARGDLSLEEIFLALTREDGAVRAAVQTLGSFR